MIRLTRYPKEKEIDTNVSLSLFVPFTVEFYEAKTDSEIFIYSKVKDYNDYRFYKTRALLYLFNAEDRLRRDFGGIFVDPTDPALKELQFNLVKRPIVDNFIQGMGLQTYALKIADNLPKRTIGFLIAFHEESGSEDILKFLQNALFGEGQNIKTFFAKKDEKLYIRFDVLASYDEERRPYTIKWVKLLLRYLVKHFPFSPLPNVNQERPGYTEPEFSIANIELDIETEKYTNPLFLQYLGEKTGGQSIFDIGADWEPIVPSKNALECFEVTRKVRLGE